MPWKILGGQVFKRRVACQLGGAGNLQLFGTSGLERGAVYHDLLHFHRRLSSSPGTATIVECLVSCIKTHLRLSGPIPVVFTSRKSPENNDLLLFCTVRCTFSNIWAHFYGDFGFHLQQNWFILVVCS